MNEEKELSSPSGTLTFRDGTLLLHFPEENTPLPEVLAHLFVRDERVHAYRSNAYNYAAILRIAHYCGMPLEDKARDYTIPELKLHTRFEIRPHQKRALEAWKNNKCRGIVEMPTGSGKSFLAVLAMASVNRSTLVVVPTIDLMLQWERNLRDFFQKEIGLLGGGSHEVKEITVATYDSAALQMGRIGNRFGLVIFDECHHLPGEVNSIAASSAIAPYRLGLSATPEREDGKDSLSGKLLGKIVCRIHIDELEGSILSPYITKRISIKLTPEEEEAYQKERSVYLSFVKHHHIDFSRPGAWQEFIALAARAPGGREAMKAYLAQRRIARYPESKEKTVWELLRKHAGERILVFTAENEAAYSMGERFCLPVITHQTKSSERKDFLDKFRSGIYPVLLTSKVLNEGVDVPEASIGIVVSGSGSTREHVQRLGRILRAKEGKQALLYELISAGTSEINVSERRRRHRAYGASPIPRREELDGEEEMDDAY